MDEPFGNVASLRENIKIHKNLRGAVGISIGIHADGVGLLG